MKKLLLSLMLLSACSANQECSKVEYKFEYLQSVKIIEGFYSGQTGFVMEPDRFINSDTFCEVPGYKVILLFGTIKTFPETSLIAE